MTAIKREEEEEVEVEVEEGEGVEEEAGEDKVNVLVCLGYFLLFIFNLFSSQLRLNC